MQTLKRGDLIAMHNTMGGNGQYNFIGYWNYDERTTHGPLKYGVMAFDDTPLNLNPSARPSSIRIVDDTLYFVLDYLPETTVANMPYRVWLVRPYDKLDDMSLGSWNEKLYTALTRRRMVTEYRLIDWQHIAHVIDMQGFHTERELARLHDESPTIAARLYHCMFDHMARLQDRLTRPKGQ